MKLDIILPIVTTVGKLVPVAADVTEAVVEAMADKEISAEDAEAIGRKIGEAAGKALTIPVNGRDVAHPPAFGLIGGGLGRLARQVIIAKRS